MARFCVDCGFELKTTSNFCPMCGKSYSATTNSRQTAQPAQQAPQPSQQAPQPSQQAAQPSQQAVPMPVQKLQAPKCNYCGAELQATSKFCLKCGKAVFPPASQQVPASQQAPNIARLAQQAPHPAQQAAQFIQQGAQPARQATPTLAQRPYAPKCDHCGAELQATSKFCLKCGKAVSSPASQQAPIAQQAPNIARPALQASQPAQQTLQPSRQAPQPARQAAQPIQQAVQPAQQPLQPIHQPLQPANQAPQPAQQAAQKAAGQAAQQIQQTIGNIKETASVSGIKASEVPGEVSLGEFGAVANAIKGHINFASILGGLGIGAGTFAGLMFIPPIPRIILSFVIAAGSIVWLIAGFIKGKKR